MEQQILCLQITIGILTILNIAFAVCVKLFIDRYFETVLSIKSLCSLYLVLTQQVSAILLHNPEDKTKDFMIIEGEALRFQRLKQNED